MGYVAHPFTNRGTGALYFSFLRNLSESPMILGRPFLPASYNKARDEKARLPLATGFFIPKWRATHKPIEINDEVTTPLFSMNAT
jgi:hypothetical protein